MKKLLLLFLTTFLINSCEEKKDSYQEKINKAEELMNSNITLEEKYNSLKEFYYDLPENLQLKYGAEFFESSYFETIITGSLETKLINVDNEIMVRVKGYIYPKFKNRVFNNGYVTISSDLSFPNESFMSIYMFENISFSKYRIDVDLLHPLDNSLQYELGTRNQKVIIDSSFLSHVCESLSGKITLTVNNQIGDRYDVVVSLFDLTDEWNQKVR